MTRSLRAFALATLTALSVVPILRAQTAPSRPEQRDADEPWEDDGTALRRFQYFYDQRAFPFTQIPARMTRREMRALRQPGVLGGARFSAMPNSASAWTALGPQPIGTGSFNTGRVSAIAVDPKNANVVYVGGAQGGVWKSTDGGTAWTPLLDQQCSLAVGTITIDPVNTSIIYVGTGEANFSGDSYYGCGVLRSTDGGATWTQLGAAEFDRANGGVTISRIWIDPRTAGSTTATLLASTSAGVYRSTDGGASWTQVLSVGYGYATDVVADPANPDIIFAAGTAVWSNAANGVYRSTDNGVTWSRVSGLLSGTSTGRIALAVSPAAPHNVWAVIVDPSTANLAGMFRSADNGNTWTPLGAAASGMTCGGQCWYNVTIAVDPTNASNLFIGTMYQMRSSNGGASFDNTNGAMHVDQHAVVFAPSDPTTVYAGNDGGIFVMRGLGSAWTSLNQNLALTQFYPGFSMLQSGGNLDLVGGAQDNGTIEYSGIPTWTPIFGGDGGFTALDSTVAGRAYVETQWVANSGYSGPRRRDASGGGFALKVAGIDLNQSGLFIPPLVMHPGHPNTLYFGVASLYRTRNSADTWTPLIPSGTLSGSVSAVGPAASDTNTIYVGTSGGNVAVTHDGGATWALGTGIPRRYITDFVVNKANPRVAYLTVSGFNASHVFRTSDGGKTWQDASGDLPDIPVNAIVQLPGGELDVGTDIGVYRSANGGVNWVPFTGGLPNVAVLDLAFDNATGTLVAATHGRGAWRSNITVVAPPALVAVDSQPAPPASGGTLGRFVVSVREVAGSLVPTASNTISVRIASGNGLLSGTTSVTAVNGVATFGDLQLAGSGPFTLSFDSPGLTSVVTDTFRLSAAASLQLARSGAHATLIAGGAETRSDSVAVYLTGDGASTVAWSSGNTAAWAIVTDPTGTGTGVLRWRRSAASLGAGTWVDTITVTPTGGAAPAVLFDTLTVLAAPTLVARFDPDTVAGSSAAPASADLMVDLTGSGGLAVGTIATTLSWDSTLVRLDSATAGDFGAPVLSAAAAGTVRVSATRTSGAAGSSRIARLYWSFLIAPAGGPTSTPIALSDPLLRSTSVTGALDMAPWLTLRAGLANYEAVLRGDVDGDGQVTATDASLILNGAVGLALPAGTKLRPNGDANCDGVVDAADAQVVLAFVAGKPVGGACVGTVR